MYTLRDSHDTYEVWRAADVGGARPLTQWVHFERTVVDLARALCRDDGNRRIMAELVEEEIGRSSASSVLHEQFAELVVCGRLVLQQRGVPRVHPLPDPSVERPMDLLPQEGELSQEAETTWISVELVDAQGESTAALELELVAADGKEIQGRLDGDGRWRTSGLVRGSCSIRLHEHAVLGKRRRRPLQARPGPGDVVWQVGSERCFELATARHHRIVIVPPPRPYCLSA